VEVTTLYAIAMRGLSVQLPVRWLRYEPSLTTRSEAWLLSVGTVLTTGWGPTPKTPLAIVLSVSEAMFGVLVLATLVSRTAAGALEQLKRRRRQRYRKQ
jgi:hypothetical protein